jgi:branched-chain amino acid transport system permease protein
LVGIPYTAMMTLGWGMAAALGSVSGALVASRLTLDPNMMGDVIIYAFAAAVAGMQAAYREGAPQAAMARFLAARATQP